MKRVRTCIYTYICTCTHMYIYVHVCTCTNKWIVCLKMLTPNFSLFHKLWWMDVYGTWTKHIGIRHTCEAQHFFLDEVGHDDCVIQQNVFWSCNPRFALFCLSFMNLNSLVLSGSQYLIRKARTILSWHNSDVGCFLTGKPGHCNSSLQDCQDKFCNKYFIIKSYVMITMYKRHSSQI